MSSMIVGIRFNFWTFENRYFYDWTFEECCISKPQSHLDGTKVRRLPSNLQSCNMIKRHKVAGWQKSIASGVAATWTANDLNHSHQIPILLTLPPHSKSDHTSNNLLATLFWPTRTPVRAPEHNTMTKWLLPLPPNTHITCTAAAIADPLNILLLWNCKTGEEELRSLLHRKLSLSLLFWICALRKGTTKTFTQSLQPYHPTKMFFRDL